MNRKPLRPILMRPFQHWISISLSQICLMLFLIVELTVQGENLSRSDAVGLWGGTGSDFAVWRGEWWRIWVTQLHHGDLLHLLGNLLCLLFFGRLIEHRMGTWQYLLFVLSAAGFSGLFQLLIGPEFVGISGVISAQFGWIVAERDRDEKLRLQFQEDSIYWFVGLLLLGIPLEWFDLLPIGNASHLAGAVCGLLWGIAGVRIRSLSVKRVLCLAANLLLIPSVSTVAHPWWNPDYYWVLADHAATLTQQIRYYRIGLEWDPGHLPLRQNLAMAHYYRGEFLTSWDVILDAVQTSPADEKTLKMAQMIGHSRLTELSGLFFERNPQTILKEHFGDDAGEWEKILLNRSTLADAHSRRPQDRPARFPGEEIESILPWKLDAGPDKKLPPPDPEAPGSAEEGTSA
jgi:membrane associated rhomboid family serine protease